MITDNYIPTITIGISAYNEERNIVRLLSDLKNQTYESVKLTTIIVVSDGSTDNTANQVKKFKDLKIKLHNSSKREGLAKSLNYILSKSISDIVVTLDADIRLPDPNFINKLVTPLIKGEVDYTASSIYELDPHSYFAKSLAVSMRLKRNIYNCIGNGHNLYTSFGLARAYTKRLSTKLRFPTSIGNDMYSFLYTISQGLNFAYVRDACAMYKLPERIGDSHTQSNRFFQARSSMIKYFDYDLVRFSMRINPTAIIRGSVYSMVDLLINFHYFVGYLFYLIYIAYLAPKIKVQDIWTTASSTKI